MNTDEIVLTSRKDGGMILKIYHSTAESGRRPYLEHHHTQCEISAILEGSCEWQIRRRPVRCGPGDVLIFGSDEEHYITAIDADTPLKILNLHFEPRFLWSGSSELRDSRYLSIFLNHGPDFSNRLPGTSEAARQISALLGQIRQECLQAQPEYTLMAKARFLLLLGLLGRQFSHLLEAPAPERAYTRQLEKALNHIDAHLTQELTLEGIAQAAGMSRSHFCAVFKAMNGISVWNYITSKRIELAMHHIRRGELSITQTALECGFNTMSNFNRSFRAVAHCTPSEYKKGLK